MKKAQIQNVFTILVTLLIIGTIALLTVRFLQGISEDKCQADLILFERDLQDIIRNGNNYGSSEQHRLATACKIHTVCFVDTQAINTQSFSVENTYTPYTFMEQSVQQGIETNIFTFTTDDVMQTHGYVSQLDLEDQNKPLCIRNTGGFFTFQTRGQGSTTRISQG